MRIFVVCNRLCYGGAERVGVTIANGLFGRGYEVYVVADLFMPVTYKLRPGIKVLNLYREGKGKYAKQLSSFKLLRSYLKQYHPAEGINKGFPDGWILFIIHLLYFRLTACQI